jgi:hypothetical protein
VSDVRREVEEAWSRAQEAGEANKNPMLVTLEMERFYDRLEPDARREADEVLIDWALGGDSAKRFDALDVIERFAVVAAVPAMRELASRYATASGPSAPFDREQVDRILAVLAEAGGSAPGGRPSG